MRLVTLGGQAHPVRPVCPLLYFPYRLSFLPACRALSPSGAQTLTLGLAFCRAEGAAAEVRAWRHTVVSGVALVLALCLAAVVAWYALAGDPFPVLPLLSQLAPVSPAPSRALTRGSCVQGGWPGPGDRGQRRVRARR